MATVLNAVEKMPLAALPYNQARFVGRVEAVRKFEGMTYTRMICPAVDAYSKPSVVEFRSKSRLGSKDEIIEVVGLVGGYMRKPYSVTDKDSGEIIKITPVDHTLDVVE